jgi:hypothetical protein
MLKSTTKEDLGPYPACPPLKILASRENLILRMATPKTVLGFFHCYNI